jgi:hypothetical protein
VPEPSVGYYDNQAALQENAADPTALQIQALYYRIDELMERIDVLQKEFRAFMEESREQHGT